REGPRPRALHPDPARGNPTDLLRHRRMDGRPSDRVRAPPHRGGAVPAPGRVSRAATPRASERMSLLEVAGLQKRFGGLLAVGGLDLSMAEGEMLGLIGPNGAGKTTVFNLLSGFLLPDDGDIRFAGRRLVGLRPHEI